MVLLVMLGSTYLGISVPQYRGAECEMYCLSEHSKKTRSTVELLALTATKKGGRVAVLGKLDTKSSSEILM